MSKAKRSWGTGCYLGFLSPLGYLKTVCIKILFFVN